jgi:hypothetical protein
MKLSREEELFLRHWMYDEVRYQEAQGSAERLQLEHRAVPADLAILIAAAIPDLSEQQAAGLSLPSDRSPRWPWTEETLRARLNEARAILAGRSKDEVSGSGVESESAPPGALSGE